MRSQREISRQARIACGAMIDANVSSGDGDLFVGVHDWSDDDRAAFAASCQRIADRLLS